MSNVYIVPESILLLVKSAAARVILDDWLDGVESDIRIRRAKTAGHVVIETHDVLFATRIRRLCPECKVHMR
jgi:hypothetical protein